MIRCGRRRGGSRSRRSGSGRGESSSSSSGCRSVQPRALARVGKRFPPPFLISLPLHHSGDPAEPSGAVASVRNGQRNGAGVKGRRARRCGGAEGGASASSRSASGSSACGSGLVHDRAQEPADRRRADRRVQRRGRGPGTAVLLRPRDRDAGRPAREQHATGAAAAPRARVDVVRRLGVQGRGQAARHRPQGGVQLRSRRVAHEQGHGPEALLEEHLGRAATARHPSSARSAARHRLGAQCRARRRPPRGRPRGLDADGKASVMRSVSSGPPAVPGEARDERLEAGTARARRPRRAWCRTARRRG